MVCFLRKNCNPPEKSQSLFPSNSPLKSPLFLKMWSESQPQLPPRHRKGERGEGVHTMNTQYSINFDFNRKVFRRTSSAYYRTSYFLLIFIEFCGCSTLCMLVLFSILNALKNMLSLQCQLVQFAQLQISSGKSRKLKFDGLLLSKKYICPTNTFLLLKHIQNIYLTLLSTTCMKIHEITYVISEIISHFSRHNSSISFQLKHYILSTKVVQSANFQTFHCLG